MKISRTRITDLIKRYESRLGSTAGILTTSDASFLLTAAAFLSKWHEQECGDDRSCIRWNDIDGKPYRDYGNGKPSHQIKDTYTPRIQTVTAWAKAKGLHIYIQTDPRGSALYLHNEPMYQDNYDRGLAID
jgi:hypothetical protein